MRRIWAVLVCLCLGCGLLFPAVVGAAEEAAAPELTLDEAITRALTHSESLKKAEKEVDRTKEMREHSQDQMDYMPLAPPGHAAVEVPWSRYLLADLEWWMSKKSLTAEEDRVVVKATRNYWDVLTAQEAVANGEAVLKNVDRQLRKVRALYNAGMAPEAALMAAAAGHRGAEAGVAAAQNDLDQAYAALNQLIGFAADERMTLVDDVTFEALEIPDLETEIRHISDRAPQVWLAQEFVTVQEQLARMMMYTGEYVPYKARKIEVDQAKYDARSARDAVRLAARELYYGVRSLEEAYAAAAEGVKTAEEALRVTQAKYDVGMATAADLVESEADLVDAKKKVSDLARDHAYMKLAFQKPWALSSAP